MQAERTFLGLVYIVNALLKIDVLHYDPNNTATCSFTIQVMTNNQKAGILPIS